MRWSTSLTAAVVAALLAGCAGGPAANRAQQLGTTPAPNGSATDRRALPAEEDEPPGTLPTPPGDGHSGAASATGTAVVARTVPAGLADPCCLVPLTDGAVMVGDRRTGRVVRVPPAGPVTDVGEVSGVALGEGRHLLLGLAADPVAPRTLFALYARTGDSMLARHELDAGESAGGQVGVYPWTLARDLPVATEGALALGPDGFLHGATGPEGVRITTTGTDRTDSSRHGAIVGITWDAAGRTWVADAAGSELRAGDGVTAPLVGTGTPAALAHADGVLWVATEVGLWRIALDDAGHPGEPQRLLHQPLAGVAADPDGGRLWVLGTDGSVLAVDVT